MPRIVVYSRARLDQMPARSDRCADAVRRGRLHMHLLAGAGSRQLGKAGGAVRICLVRLHRLQTLVRLAGVDADDPDTELT